MHIASLTAPMYSKAKMIMFFTLSQLDWTTTKETLLRLHLALVQPHFESRDQQGKVGSCPPLPALGRPHMEDSAQDSGPQHKDVQMLECVQSKATKLKAWSTSLTKKLQGAVVDKCEEQKALETPHCGLPILKES